MPSLAVSCQALVGAGGVGMRGMELQLWLTGGPGELPAVPHLLMAASQ